SVHETIADKPRCWGARRIAWTRRCARLHKRRPMRSCVRTCRTFRTSRARGSASLQGHMEFASTAAETLATSDCSRTRPPNVAYVASASTNEDGQVARLERWGLEAGGGHTLRVT